MVLQQRYCSCRRRDVFDHVGSSKLDQIIFSSPYIWYVGAIFATGGPISPLREVTGSSQSLLEQEKLTLIMLIRLLYRNSLSRMFVPIYWYRFALVDLVRSEDRSYQSRSVVVQHRTTRVRIRSSKCSGHQRWCAFAPCLLYYPI